MVPEFDQACFDMETGEVRGPIKTRFGYHLIRLDGKGEGKPVSFNEAAEQIKLATRRYSKRQRSWLRGEAGLTGLRAQDKPLEQLLDESLQLIAAARQAVK